MTEKKYIILSDIKEFTYKNALLTNLQIEQMLQSFDDIVVHSAQKYDISIVKSIGDAYLALGKSAQSAYLYAQEILSLTQKYDETHKIAIKKLNLRAVMTYGEITKNRSMNLDDYFGESINLAARIIDITPAGKIFIDSKFKNQLAKKQKALSLGEHKFHGILTKTELFSLSEMSQGEISLLADDEKTILKECDNIVFRSACVSAVLSAQPLPFIESFNIVGVHLYMIIKLSQKLERGVTLHSGAKVFKEVVSPLGAGYFGSQGLATLVKIALPGIGGYLFSPISFAITYALGKVYTAYFFYEKGGDYLTSEDISSIFTKQKDMGRSIVKREKKSILKTGKQFYRDVLSIKKKSGYSSVQKDLVIMLKSQK